MWRGMQSLLLCGLDSSAGQQFHRKHSAVIGRLPILGNRQNCPTTASHSEVINVSVMPITLFTIARENNEREKSGMQVTGKKGTASGEEGNHGS